MLRLLLETQSETCAECALKIQFLVINARAEFFKPAFKIIVLSLKS